MQGLGEPANQDWRHGVNKASPSIGVIELELELERDQAIELVGELYRKDGAISERIAAMRHLQARQPELFTNWYGTESDELIGWLEWLRNEIRNQLDAIAS